MISKIFQAIANIDFNKYCNCYSIAYGTIDVECYDTILEAINKHESRTDDYRVDSRLVNMNKFWPQFIQKIIVQNEFRKPVVFQSKFAYSFNKNDD
jgi:hypothetical protein